MKRLGYTRYVAQGGDWGSPVSQAMALGGSGRVLGIHTNLPATVPHEIAAGALNSAAHRRRVSQPTRGMPYDQLDFSTSMAWPTPRRWGTAPDAVRDRGFACRPRRMDARPRRAQFALIARVFDGQPEGLTRDDNLDNITLYWLTNTAVSSARLYWENKLAFFAPKHVAIPVAVSVFPDEISPSAELGGKRFPPKLIHYNRLDKGGHFAAWEQPEIFVQELRAAFKPLRLKPWKRTASYRRPPASTREPPQEKNCCAQQITKGEDQCSIFGRHHSRYRRDLLAASAAAGALVCFPWAWLKQPTATRSVPSASTFRKRNSSISAAASRRHGGPTRNGQ